MYISYAPGTTNGMNHLTGILASAPLRGSLWKHCSRAKGAFKGHISSSTPGRKQASNYNIENAIASAQATDLVIGIINDRHPIKSIKCHPFHEQVHRLY